MAGKITRTIQRAIRESGMTLRELELKSGVAAAQVSRFMNDQRSLTLPAVEDLCKVLKLEIRPRQKPKRKGK